MTIEIAPPGIEIAIKQSLGPIIDQATSAFLKEPTTAGAMAMKRFIAAFRGRWVVQIEGLSTLSESELGWLAASGRPFMQPTRALGQAALRFGKANLPSGRELLSSPDTAARRVQDAMAEGIQKQLLIRWTAQGNDISLRALSPMYRAFKAKHGLDTRIGIATGMLLREMRAARFSLQRR